jgi:hypothetical protein
LQKRFDKLNKKDRNTELAQLQEEVSNWDAVQEYKSAVSECTNRELLFELSYMSTMYRRPLGAERKISARNTLQRLFNDTKDEAEQKMIFSVITYYKLME